MPTKKVRILSAAMAGGLVFTGVTASVITTGHAPARAALAADTAGPVPDLGTCTNQLMAVGSSGPCVESLQQSLAALGIKLAADGLFGSRTRLAVYYYQGWDGLTQDGIAGPSTIAALNWSANSPTPPGRGPLPAMPDADAQFSPAGTSVMTCTAGSCSYYFGRAATVKINDELSKPSTGLAGGIGGTGFCGALTAVWGAGTAAGIACGVAWAAATFDIQQDAGVAVSQNSCLEIKIQNLGPVGGTAPEVLTNDGHNCIP
jgi:hypothetical protein